MYRYGPLVRHWTMRYEAKHSYFKSLAQSMGNFINLPYSLAMRHQQHQCYVHMKNVQEAMTTGPGIQGKGGREGRVMGPPTTGNLTPRNFRICLTHTINTYKAA